MMIESEKETPGSGGIADLVIASKTGTAEHGTDPKNTPPHAWYVAFAPADNPQVAVAVMVENGGDLGLDATGAKVAGPDRPLGHRRRARRGARDVGSRPAAVRPLPADPPDRGRRHGRGVGRRRHPAGPDGRA